MTIDKIASSAEYRIDKQFLNSKIILIIFQVEKNFANLLIF